MKMIAALLLMLVLPVAAQDKADLLKQAADLERKAEALLDQGKRAAAFDLLARAADLREKARTGKISKKPAPKPPQDKAVDKPKQPDRKPNAAQRADRAVKALDAALAAGDPMKTQAAGKHAVRAMRAWQRGLRERERAMARRQKALDERIRALEIQLAKVRRMIEGQPPAK